MPAFETRSSQFGLVSGIRQASSDMVLVAEPAGLFAPEARKGQLYIVAEADQDVARGRDACQLASRIIRVVNAYDDLVGDSTDLASRLDAVERLRLGMAYEYDPRVVEALTRVLEKNSAL